MVIFSIRESFVWCWLNWGRKAGGKIKCLRRVYPKSFLFWKSLIKYLKGKASCLLRDDSQLEYRDRWRSPISGSCVILVIRTVVKCDRDRYFIRIRITTLGRMQVHRRNTSALITQLRVYSISCWKNYPNKEFSTLLFIPGIVSRIFWVPTIAPSERDLSICWLINDSIMYQSTTISI